MYAIYVHLIIAYIYRYTLSVSATDIGPNDENKRIVNQFMFLVTTSQTRGKNAILLAAPTKGRPDFVSPAIANTVGKSCTVVADVSPEFLTQTTV
jgi:hypothetical protein